MTVTLSSAGSESGEHLEGAGAATRKGIPLPAQGFAFWFSVLSLVVLRLGKSGNLFNVIRGAQFTMSKIKKRAPNSLPEPLEIDWTVRPHLGILCVTHSHAEPTRTCKSQRSS